MLDALPPDARAVAATMALAALPGLVVVRAPWRAVPLVSLAFWVTSWTWPLESRTRFLHVALIALATLALFRVLRPGPLPRPGKAQMLIVAAALLLAIPYVRGSVPSGNGAPMDALTAQLLCWRDGWPASFEPLSPQRPFQAGGLSGLAADVVLISGAPAHRALFAMTVLAEVTLLLALWSLVSTRVTPGRAAIIAALGVLPAAFMGEGSGALACAFAAEAAALWHDRRGHPSAFTAGACVAAALATDVATALCAVLLAFLLAWIGRDPADGRSGEGLLPARARTAVATAIVLALPLLWRVPPFAPPDAASLGAVALAGLLAVMAEGRAITPWRMVVCALALAATAAASAARVTHRAVTRDEEAAMVWIRDHSRPLDLVCAPDVPAARWIPALSARATPAALRPGWPRAEGACTVLISLSGALPPGVDAAATPSYRAGGTAVWTTSQQR